MKQLNCTFGEFTKSYDHEIKYCDSEWFEKRFCMLLSPVSHWEFECPEEIMTESAMKKIPGMGPKRIQIIFDNAEYFGFKVI
jgi:hypothetical protein